MTAKADISTQLYVIRNSTLKRSEVGVQALSGTNPFHGRLRRAPTTTDMLRITCDFFLRSLPLYVRESLSAPSRAARAISSRHAAAVVHARAKRGPPRFTGGYDERRQLLTCCRPPAISSSGHFHYVYGSDSLCHLVRRAQSQVGMR